MVEFRYESVTVLQIQKRPDVVAWWIAHRLEISGSEVPAPLGKGGTIICPNALLCVPKVACSSEARIVELFQANHEMCTGFDNCEVNLRY